MTATFLSAEELQDLLPDLIAGAIRTAGTTRPTSAPGTTTMSFGTVVAVTLTTCDVQLDEDAQGVLTTAQVSGSVTVGQRVPVFFTDGGGAIVIGGGTGGGTPTGSSTLTDYRALPDGKTYSPATGTNEETPPDVFAVWPEGLTKGVAIPSWATKALVFAKLGQVIAAIGLNSTNVALVLGSYDYRGLGAGVVDYQHFTWDAGVDGVGDDERQEIVLGPVLIDIPEELQGSTQTLATVAVSSSGSDGRLRVNEFSSCSIDVVFFGTVDTEISQGGPPGPPGPPGGGSVYINVQDYGAVGGFDSQAALGASDLGNLANVAANDIAFAAAIAAAEPVKGTLWMPDENYGISPDIIDLVDNNVGLLGESHAKCTLWMVGTGICVDQQGGPLTWGDRDSDTGPDTGLPAWPRIDGFTISGLFAGGGSVGLRVGNNVGGYWNVRVHDFKVETGASPVAGMLGSIGILVQNSQVRKDPDTGLFDKWAWTEESVFGPQSAVRHNYHSIVIDGGNKGNGSSFGYNKFLRMFTQGGIAAAPAYALEIVNNAWLYNCELSFTGNWGNGTYIRVGDDDSKFNGQVSIQIEGVGGDLVMFDVDADSNWQSEGTITVNDFGFDSVTCAIPHSGCFHHEGHSTLPGLPSMDGWHSQGVFGAGTGARVSGAIGSQSVFTLGGDWSKRFREGVKVRWVENVTKKFAVVDGDATYSSGTDRTTITLAANGGYGMTASPEQGSLRYSNEVPADWPFSVNESDALIGSIRNAVTGPTTLVGDDATVAPFHAGPTWQLYLRKTGDDPVTKLDKLGQLSFGGQVSPTVKHNTVAGVGGFARSNWADDEAAAGLRFFATPRSSIAPQDIGVWTTQGIAIDTRYTQNSEALDAPDEQLGTSLNLRVNHLHNFAGQAQTQEPYSILGQYPRARVNLEGPVYEKQNDGFAGQPPSFQHSLMYTDAPVAVTIAPVANYASMTSLTVDTTRQFPASGHAWMGCWHKTGLAVDAIWQVEFDYDSLDINGTTFTEIHNRVVTPILGSPGTAVTGAFVRGVASATNVRSLISGQGFLNVPTVLAAQPNSFPVPAEVQGADAHNWPGYSNNWQIGFYDGPVLAAMNAEGDPDNSGLIDNIQAVSFVSYLFAQPGTRTRTRYGMLFEDTGGGSGVSYRWRNTTGSGGTGVRAITSLTLSGGQTTSGLAPSGRFTVETSDGIAVVAYTSKTSTTLDGLSCVAGTGTIANGARVGFGALVDVQAAIAIGKLQGDDGTLLPLTSAAENYGLKMAVGGSGPETQYGVFIDKTGTASLSGGKVGIQNNASLIQAGPSLFANDVTFAPIAGPPTTVDFTGANVVGLDEATGYMRSDGTINYTSSGALNLVPIFANDGWPIPFLGRINGSIPLAMTKVLSGQLVGQIAFGGQYENATTTSQGIGASIVGVAAADYTASQRPTILRFDTVPTGSNTAVPSLYVNAGAGAGNPGSVGVPGAMLVQGAAGFVDNVTLTSGKTLTLTGVNVVGFTGGTPDIANLTSAMGAQHFGSVATGQIDNGDGGYFDSGNRPGSSPLPLNTPMWSSDYATVPFPNPDGYPMLDIVHTGRFFICDAQPGIWNEPGFAPYGGGIDHRIFTVTDRVNLPIMIVSNVSGVKVNDSLCIVNTPHATTSGGVGPYNRHQIGMLFRDGLTGRSIHALCFGMQANASWDTAAFWDGVLPINAAITGGITGQTRSNNPAANTGLWISQMSSPGGGSGGAGTTGSLGTSARFVTPWSNSAGFTSIGAFGDLFGTGVRWSNIAGSGPSIVFTLTGSGDVGGWLSTSWVGLPGASLGVSGQRWGTVFANNLDIPGHDWVPPTGTFSRATFNATSGATNLTLAQLAQRVAQIIVDLQNIGIFN